MKGERDGGFRSPKMPLNSDLSSSLRDERLHLRRERTRDVGNSTHVRPATTPLPAFCYLRCHLHVVVFIVNRAVAQTRNSVAANSYSNDHVGTFVCIIFPCETQFSLKEHGICLVNASGRVGPNKGNQSRLRTSGGERESVLTRV